MSSRGRGSTSVRGGGRSTGGGRGGRGAPTISSSSSSSSSSVHEVGGSSSSTPPPPPPTVDSLISDVQKSLNIEEPILLSAVSSTVTPPPVSSKLVKYPARPGFGTEGDRCVVKANHFIVKLADTDLHHYDVSITPEVTSRGVNRAVISQLVDLHRTSHLGGLQPVYDGMKSLYTARPLPFKGMVFVVHLADKEPAKGGSRKTDKNGKGAFPRRERKFKVVIKFASRPDLHHLRQFLAGKQRDSPHEVIQALDVVMRETPTKGYAVVGRSFFSPMFGGKGDIGDGLEVWKGYYQSIRPTQMGLSLNIDVSATSFYKSVNVVDYVIQLLNLRDPQRRPLSDVDRVKIKRALKGVRVELTHRNGNCLKISGITSQPTNQLMFPVEDGTNESVVRYFEQKYNIRLKFPHWPCLQAGSNARPAYLPMEVCAITEGQKYSKKLNEKQVTGMLRAACQRPREREDNIAKIVRENHYEEDKYAKEFGIDVSYMMTSINGARVLTPPMLKYNDSGRDKRIQPHVGQWNMMNARMVNGAKVDHWACLNFSQRTPPDVAQSFFKQLVGMCNSKGLNINPMPLLPMWSGRSGQIERTLVNLHKEASLKLAKMAGHGNQLQLLIIILPDQTGSYGTIKRVCETELGIVSQCCQPKHAFKVSPQYLENVTMKINVKVGGRNNVLEAALTKRLRYVSDCPTIIFGADVTHPQAGEDSSPSIAAVVASMDWPEVTKYRCLVSAQLHRQELISDLHKVQEVNKKLVHGGMIRDHLIAFKKATGHKPHRIIFYRDGVSEGQFAQVLLHEIDAIHKACASLEEGYLPPITFIVVQKRHHTRLFPANHMDRNMIDRSGNILPGTVVDSMICHPTEFDFYLCSHAGIQGTSRPTHYHVLYDENKFTADGLQTLTNNLCYTYARCTRSVSVVPPAYYAHLGAFRARYYIEGDAFEGSDSTSSHGGGANTRAATASVRPLPKIKDCVKDVMFYV